MRNEPPKLADVISIRRGETPPLAHPIPFGTPDPTDTLIEILDNNKTEKPTDG